MTAPGTTVNRIATAPARGGATVTAFHIPAQHRLFVACSRHGVLAADTYGPDATDVEFRAGRRAANVRVYTHATGCTAKHSHVLTPLTGATPGGQP